LRKTEMPRGVLDSLPIARSDQCGAANIPDRLPAADIPAQRGQSAATSNTDLNVKTVIREAIRAKLR
jgi:hypothetical protein